MANHPRVASNQRNHMPSSQSRLFQQPANATEKAPIRGNAFVGLAQAYPAEVTGSNLVGCTRAGATSDEGVPSRKGCRWVARTAAKNAPTEDQFSCDLMVIMQLHSTNNTDLWIERAVRRTPPRFRLFCFPYAGGGAGMFRDWSSEMPPTMEVGAIRLPGRERR
jgi:hypothetical protein